MLMFGLRLGDDPRVVVTTTPKPIKIIRELIADPTTAITRGSTYDNRANLAPAFLHQIVKKYEGTRLGRQELNAEILDDVPGALWSRALIEDLRWPAHKNVPDLIRIVVAIDPAASTGEDADETGIIVAGKDANGHGYVLADQSGRIRRPNGRALQLPSTVSTRPIALSRRSTRRHGRGHRAHGGPKRQLCDSARESGQSYAGRTRRGTLRTASRASRRNVSDARGSTMRICR